MSKQNLSLKSGSSNITHPLGFTLIEIMVVITIIGLVFGVVISSINYLRSSSSDAKRKADLAQIQSALQNYYADLNYYPRSTGTGGFRISGTGAQTSLTSAMGLSSPPPVPAPALRTYLGAIPVDPSNQYCYVAVNNSSANDNTCDNTSTRRCNFYYLSVRLDAPSPTMTIPATGQCSGYNANYVVTP